MDLMLLEGEQTKENFWKTQNLIIENNYALETRIGTNIFTVEDQITCRTLEGEGT